MHTYTQENISNTLESNWLFLPIICDSLHPSAFQSHEIHKAHFYYTASWLESEQYIILDVNTDA